MDFAQVDAAMGQMDGQYAKNVPMQGIIDTPSPIQFHKTSGRPSQQVYVTDGPGIRNRVKIVGKFPDLTTIDASRTVNFEIHAYIATYDNNKYYMGFCNVAEDQNSKPATPAQRAAQPAQKAAPPPAVTVPGPHQNAYVPVVQPTTRDYDKENRGKCRFGLYQACLQAGILPGDLSGAWKLLDAIELLVGYSMCGLPAHDEDGPLPDFVGKAGQQYAQDNEMPAPDQNEDIPF